MKIEGGLDRVTCLLLPDQQWYVVKDGTLELDDDGVLSFREADRIGVTHVGEGSILAYKTES